MPQFRTLQQAVFRSPQLPVMAAMFEGRLERPPNTSPERAGQNLPGEFAVPAAANLIQRMQAQHAVALRLRLVEPLVACTLMRERRVRGSVCFHIRRLGAEQHRFDINQLAVRPSRVHSRIADRRNGAAAFLFAHWLHILIFELDGHVQIDSYLAQRISQIFVSERSGSQPESSTTICRHRRRIIS